MGLFDVLFKKIGNNFFIDLNTLEGIERIPPTPDNPSVNGQPMYYALQRKATEHKKNGNMELAIACLRKSNAISDKYERIPLLEKDYLRLPKYIASTGNKELAQLEEKKIYSTHPEFLDKRITTAKLIKECIDKNKEWNNDLIRIHSRNSCPQCKKYNGKIYSISGKSKYQKIPQILLEGGECTEHSMGANTFFPGISSE